MRSAFLKRLNNSHSEAKHKKRKKKERGNISTTIPTIYFTVTVTDFFNFHVLFGGVVQSTGVVCCCNARQSCTRYSKDLFSGVN